MEIIVSVSGKKYGADLTAPIDISIPLKNGSGPIAFFAPAFEMQPLRSGDFTGSLEEGGPVNFYNIRINPHGNGTHTESLLHINRKGKSINQTLQQFHFLARLITVHPGEKGEDKVITADMIKKAFNENIPVEALIIRTQPNTESKKLQNYSGKNPPYFLPAAIEYINRRGVQHLLTDLPSIDKEEDGGVLLAHNSFWNTSSEASMNKTITEMIFVDKEIEDGLYLLNMQIISIEGDASPSKPVLYQLKKSEIFE